MYLTGQIRQPLLSTAFVAIRLPGFLNVPCWPRMQRQQWYDDTHSNSMQTHGKIYATATTCFCVSQQVQRCLCRNSSDCANWTCHPAIQRHGVAYPRLHKTCDALISYCKFPAVRNWLMKREWAIADRGLHFPNIIYMIDEVYIGLSYHYLSLHLALLFVAWERWDMQGW